jgi:Ca2+-binding RTX toxin-like protein
VRMNTWGLRTLGVAAAASLAVSFGAAGSAGAAQSPSASVANDRLTVTGTRHGDVVRLGLDANNPNLLNVDLNGYTQSFDRSTFVAIAVELRGGNDDFAITGAFGDEALTVNGGNGDDTLTGSSANDVLKGGAGNDRIFGSAGDDLIFAGAGRDSVDAGLGRDTVFLGGADDQFIWTPGQGSDIVDGGDGFDTMRFVGSGGNEIMSLSAIGHQAEFLRDLGNIRMTLDRLERVDTIGGGGSDKITIDDLRGTDVRQAKVDISQSDPTLGQSSTVVVNGTDRADHVNVDAPTFDQVVVTGLKADTHITGARIGHHLQVNTGDGNDRVAVANTVDNIGVAVDLGAGQH